MLDVCVKELKKSDYAFLHNLVKELPEKCDSIEDYLFMSNILTSIQEKLYFKLKQIKKVKNVPILSVYIDDYYFVFDGHHRTYAAFLRGDKTIKSSEKFQ